MIALRALNSNVNPNFTTKNITIDAHSGSGISYPGFPNRLIGVISSYGSSGSNMRYEISCTTNSVTCKIGWAVEGFVLNATVIGY